MAQLRACPERQQWLPAVVALARPPNATASVPVAHQSMDDRVNRPRCVHMDTIGVRLGLEGIHELLAIQCTSPGKNVPLALTHRSRSTCRALEVRVWLSRTGILSHCFVASLLRKEVS
eukprot:scaffold7225_cov379-Prasinococcus_capsulatus_cf.AAC.18